MKRIKRVIAVALSAAILFALLQAGVIFARASINSIIVIEDYKISFSNSYKSGDYYTKLQKCYNELIDENLQYDYGYAVAKIAKSQVGYHESNGSSNLTGNSTGSDNYTEYNRWYFSNYTNHQAWCNLFVSWCFAAAGLKPSGNYYPKNPFYLNQWRDRDAEVYSWKDYKEGSFTPQPGDVIVYGTSTTNNKSGSSLGNSTNHIGIIVEYSNGVFTTVEGNISSKVGYRKSFTPNADTGYVYKYTNSKGKKVSVYVHAIVQPYFNTNPCNHAPEYQSKGYCSKCNRWLPNKQDNRTTSCVQYTVSTATFMVQHPYQYSKDSYSAVGDYKPVSLSVGTKVDVYGYVINGFGNKWYYLKYGGKEGYVYYERLTCECKCSTSYAGEYTCTSSSYLNIHSDHSWSDDTVIGTIPSGATVKVIKSDGKYAHITYNGKSGIVSLN